MTNKYLEKVARTIGGVDVTAQQGLDYDNAWSKNNSTAKVIGSALLGAPIGGVGAPIAGSIAYLHLRNKAMRQSGLKKD